MSEKSRQFAAPFDFSFLNFSRQRFSEEIIFENSEKVNCFQQSTAFFNNHFYIAFDFRKLCALL